ncbi:FAD-dependent oxidoreductase [Brytella acorum]|uniref:FAD-dependent oxidoreductase n=1 Tax=Brytella acorum TaxID=2959299 RepID=UPI0025ADB6FC|nr:FAD-dependent oxidoreductase [Brytella acorum]MDF3625227.1 FAD-dependent oxidoreductase [Brytella acorum]
METSRHIVVIGGGVVGLCAAYALLRRGHEVTLIEALPQVGHQASYANGGQLSYRYVSPLADAGVPTDAIRWLFRADSPIALTLRADCRQWRWLLEFLRACRADINRAHAALLLELALRARDSLTSWRHEGLGAFDWRQAGKLVIHRRSAALKKAAAHIVQQDLQHVLTADECIATEPALDTMRGRFAGGIFTPDEEVADCAKFCEVLDAKMSENPLFSRLKGEATLHSGSGGGRELRASVMVEGVTVDADDVVVAAGLNAAGLLRRCGVDVPIYGLKGYSLTVTHPQGVVPSISVTDYANRVVYARLGDRLRAAAMVNIGATQAAPNPRRIAQLRKLAQDIFPLADDYAHADVWAGFRPATPTGLPIVGRAPGFSNLYIDAGQGALGFTLAPGCGEVIADLISGDTLPSSMTAFGLA